MALVLLLTLAVGPTGASQLEVVELSYRQASELLPALRPHLRGDESVSGMGTQLVLRAEPARLTALRDLVRDLDRRPRSLLISVRQGERLNGEESGAGLRLPSRSGDARVRVYSSESARRSEVTQQLRVLEGRPGRIAAGVDLPVTDRQLYLGEDGVGSAERTRYLSLETGFFAIPHLSGDVVRLEIAAEAQQAVGGRDEQPVLGSHRVVTEVEGRLGQWIQIGGTELDDRQRGGGLIYRSEAARQEARRVWLKVELLD